MDEQQRRDLYTLLYTWVQTHPHREAPTLILMGQSYSPEDLLNALEERTPLGEDLGDFLYTTAQLLHLSVQDLIHQTKMANLKER